MARFSQKYKLWILASIAAFGAVVAVAELADVYLKNGTVIRGDVAWGDDGLVIRNADGQKIVPKDEIDRVEPVNPKVDIDKEYKRRFDALSPQDTPGHVQLAGWLADQKRWDLVIIQCDHILGIEPNHAEIKQLKRAAEEKLEAQNKREEERGIGTPHKDPLKPGRLSDKDINRLKFYEFGEYDQRRSDPKMRFAKLSRKRAIEQRILGVLARIDEAGEAFLVDEYTRANPRQKLRIIAENTGLEFANDIEIVGDPVPMSMFKRDVYPLLRRGCMKSGCHGPTGRAAKFRFPRGSRSSDATAYTTFLILDELETEDGPLVDRSAPSHSLLLSYILPYDVSQKPHPLIDGKEPIKALVRNQHDKRYQAVQTWINRLSLPHPEYELDYLANKKPKAEESKTETPENSEPTKEDGSKPKQRPS